MSETTSNYGNSDLGHIERINLGGRDLVIWVPAKLAAHTPILIAHDAQNYIIPVEETWNGQNWGVIEALESGRIKATKDGLLPLIASVVLTDINLRINELMPEDFVHAHPGFWDDHSSPRMTESRALMGNAYADAVALDVIPALCERFGIDHHMDRTAISGSSMGGLAALYAVARHPEVYGTALAYSTHWPIGGNDLVDYLVDALPNDGHHHFYIDAGDLELDAAYPPLLERATQRLLARGMHRERDFVTKVIAGTGHKESWWAMRVDTVTNWWLAQI